jgi:hypothetical protein
MSKLVIRIATLVVLTVGLASCGETPVSRYATMAEARSAGAIDRGWVPSFLPESTTSILESHNIDTNETWGTFRFSPTEAMALRGSLVETELTAQRLRRPAGIPHWPAVLEGQIARDSLRQAGLELFKASSQDLFVALDSKAGVGFFWRGVT